MEKDLIDWIQRISKPMDELGGFSVCPFAKKALEEKGKASVKLMHKILSKKGK